MKNSIISMFGEGAMCEVGYGGQNVCMHDFVRPCVCAYICLTNVNT